MKRVNLVGYSGHAFVVCDIFISMGYKPFGYFEDASKQHNPYDLIYMGKEAQQVDKLQNYKYFVAIGDNIIRKKATTQIALLTQTIPINAIHSHATVSNTASLGNGIMVGNGAIVNACAKLSNGVICNTQSVIEHECEIASYAHIAPGAVLCGNVTVGEGTFVGARAVIKEGIHVGANVIIGAGTVVVSNVPDNTTVVGNPQRIISK